MALKNSWILLVFRRERFRAIIGGHTRVTSQLANVLIMHHFKRVSLIWMSSLLQVWLEIFKVDIDQWVGNSSQILWSLHYW